MIKTRQRNEAKKGSLTQRTILRSQEDGDGSSEFHRESAGRGMERQLVPEDSKNLLERSQNVKRSTDCYHRTEKPGRNHGSDLVAHSSETNDEHCRSNLNNDTAKKFK